MFSFVCALSFDMYLKKTMLDAVALAKELMASYHVADSLDALFTALRRANKYIDETTPWVLAKNEADKPRLATVIYNLLETVRIAAVVLTPYLPSTAEKIFGQLGTDMKDYSTVASFGALKSGEALGEAFTLFARVDEKKFFETIEAKRAAEEKAAEEEKCDAPAVEPEIAFDEFTKVDLRVAEVLEGEPVPKPGDYSVILDSAGEAVCIIRTTKAYVEAFDQVGAEHAFKEGEGDRSLDYWRRIHMEYFTEELGAVGLSFDKGSALVCEEFELVYVKPSP
jgi:methionyl-tRNA synthetase